MKPFLMIRTEDETGISGTGVVAEGVEFLDGTVVIRWQTHQSDHHSTVVWDSIEKCPGDPRTQRQDDHPLLRRTSSTLSSPVLTVAEETTWLLQRPAFKERPATIDEFLGPKYLNIEDKVRPGIRLALKDIFGHGVPNGKRISQVEAAMVTGAIGIGKTTLASIALPYMVHWVLCLKDPQDFYELLPGSRIAFMQMSTSETHAREVIFGDIKARIDSSPWFKDWPYDKRYAKQIRFEKNIWILPGDSARQPSKATTSWEEFLTKQTRTRLPRRRTTLSKATIRLSLVLLLVLWITLILSVKVIEG